MWQFSITVGNSSCMFFIITLQVICCNAAEEGRNPKIRFCGSSILNYNVAHSLNGWLIICPKLWPYSQSQSGCVMLDCDKTFLGSVVAEKPVLQSFKKNYNVYLLQNHVIWMLQVQLYVFKACQIQKNHH